MTDAPKKDGVLLDWHDNIAIFTLNYPEKRNAWAMHVKTRAVELMTELMSDKRCGAIVLTGAGGNFSAGGDIAAMRPRDVIERRQGLEISHQFIRLVITGPKAVVGAVEGYAYGAGVSMATACDYTVAASNSKFCCAFINIGLAPDVAGRWTMAQRVGANKAKELATLATVLNGAEAGRIGLVNRVCEPGAALETAIEVAKLYAAKPPLSVALIKAAFARGSDSLEDALRCELDYQPVLGLTEDHKEATRAFLEKRKPVFTGR